MAGRRGAKTLNNVGDGNLHKMEKMVEKLPDVDAELKVLRAIVWAVTAAIIAIDTDGKIVFANKQVHKVLGYDQAELTGRPFTDIIPERDRAMRLERLKQYNASGHQTVIGREVKACFLKADGTEVELTLEVGAPQPDDGRQVVVAAIREE